jgi:hypothetical protein
VNLPSALVVRVWERPVLGNSTLTVAEGKGSPLDDLTIPLIVAVVTCASETNAIATKPKVMITLCSVEDFINEFVSWHQKYNIKLINHNQIYKTVYRYSIFVGRGELHFKIDHFSNIY